MAWPWRPTDAPSSLRSPPSKMRYGFTIPMGTMLFPPKDTRPATPPTFSHDGKSLYYLLRHDSPESPSELWRANLDSGISEAVVPGVSIREYDISNDEKEVVFTTQPAGQASQLWLAPLDRSSPPRMISESGEATPHFGPNGQVLFRFTDGKANYLAKMGLGWLRPDQGFSVPDPRLFWNFSGPPFRDPGRSVTWDPRFRGRATSWPSRRGRPCSPNVCDDACPVRWSPDGRYFYHGHCAVFPHQSRRQNSGDPGASGRIVPAIARIGYSFGRRKGLRFRESSSSSKATSLRGWVLPTPT